MTEAIRWTIKVSPDPADDFLLALKNHHGTSIVNARMLSDKPGR